MVSLLLSAARCPEFMGQVERMAGQVFQGVIKSVLYVFNRFMT